MQLYQKYRPNTLDGIIGQDRAVATLKTIQKREGYGGQSFWISGGSGRGKSTLAYVIAADIADKSCWTETTGSGLTSAMLSSWTDSLRYASMSRKGGYALIVNEAHGLRKDIIIKLLDVLERLPRHAVVIFTTTSDGQERLFEEQVDAGPFASRCKMVSLTANCAQAFAEHVKNIAMAEGIDGQPLEKYIRLAKETRNNMREMLQAVVSGNFK